MEKEKEGLKENQNEMIHRLQTVADVEQFQMKYETDIQMSREEIETLLSYFEIREIIIGEVSGELMQGNVEYGNDSVCWEATTLDDVIDLVCEWNYERLTEAEAIISHPESFVGVPDIEARYAIIKEDYDVLDQLFDRTKYGKEIEGLAVHLAQELLSSLDSQNRFPDLQEELEGKGGKIKATLGNIANQIKDIQSQENQIGKAR